MAIIAPAALVVIVVVSPLAAGGAAPPSPAIGMPGCDTTCGNISVPYPFGMGPARCYHSPGFNLTCDNTITPPRLLLGGGGILQVEGFILEMSMVLVRRTPGDIRVDADDGSGSLFAAGLGNADEGAYIMLPDVWNELVLLGCNVRATLLVSSGGDSGNGTVVSACSSLCGEKGHGPLRDVPSSLESSMLCTGEGCCQAPIVAVKAAAVSGSSYSVQIEWFGRNNRSADEERMPTRVFVANKGWFENKKVSRQLLYPKRSPAKDVATGVPIWLSWEFGQDPSRNHRHSNISSSSTVRCDDDLTQVGYTCYCKQGYQGNPYIPDGCQDINECELPEDYCPGGVCTNTIGSFDCGCPPGTHGNNSTPGGCVPFISEADRCSPSCGEVHVHYPFGVGPSHCYRPGFNLTCDYPGSGKPPRLLLDSYGAFQIQEISIQNSTLRVTSSVATIEAETINPYSFHFNNYFSEGGDALFSLSTRNELVLSGCNVQATLLGPGDDPTIVSGCATFCSDSDMNAGRVPIASHASDKKSCYGMGCCRAPISTSIDGMPDMLSFKFADPNSVQNNSQPPYALIAEEGWFDNRLISDQQIHAHKSKLRFKPNVPIILQWEVLHPSGLPNANMKSLQKCPTEVAANICKSTNSHCKPGNRGYSCRCREGYHGNPYAPKGCKGGPVTLKGISVIIGVSCGMGLVILVLASLFVSKKLKHRRTHMLKRKFFEQNHGQLLEQLVSQRAGIAEQMIITLEELNKATHNFDKDLVVGGGGHGTVYKGILSNQHIVAIKKPKKVIPKEIDEFINEVAILSQINHKNVVKLYGCCLETEVPMLVYEFISNGTLYDHLHVEGPISLSWNNRLRIATETAKSLAYLHSTAAIPIIHRDVKSANILLDDTLVAKVADFGASRYIPMEKSGLTTRAQGTRGYWDPMYFYTGRLTEKSDVYSFGVVLVELLTRKKPFSYLSSDDESLIVHFVTLFLEGNLLQILDPQVIQEGGKEVQEVAAIATSCVKLSGEGRPTMRQVELTLEGLRASEEHVLDKVVAKKVYNNNIKVGVQSNTLVRKGNEGSTRRYSMEEEFILSASYPW
ncbi:hypothetical protein CFC21_079271 [Triticum aestivum]|nr:wall-associated receptor kinase 5-like [Triticum aestivum]XP_045085093.1 wall-associated receptor kinase 5-like [Aegilops tauschii subsp. strangulata]KAF7074398.1 hypothetical protein CFC21_079271 [Triticum aestivum]